MVPLSGRRRGEEVMPMGVPPVADEREGLLAYLEQQRHAMRTAVYGLTEDQARRTPTASQLSVGGLLKHVVSVEKGWIDHVAGTDSTSFHDYQAYAATFAMTGDDTISDLLARYQQAAARTDDVIAGVADLGQAVPVPKDVPWFPDDVEAWSVRWVLLHLIEETARHAGHADIVRECVDGATAGSLMAAAEGWEPTQWLKPWKPQASMV
jgi:uncharacterized damage-inducible protein DinB